MTYKRLSRVAGLLAAAVVAVVTFAVSAHAVLTITTPNAFTSTYSLGTGGNGPTITPPANEPVFVMGDETMAGDVGSSDMTVVNSVGQDKELVWNGLESDGTGVTSSFSTTPGTHIIYIDFAHCVDLQVASTTSFRVHNGCSTTEAGSVTEVW